MPKNKIIIILGAFVALLHIVNGLPSRWESLLTIAAGLSIVLLSVLTTVDKKMSQKAKAQKRQARKIVPSDLEEGIMGGRRITDSYPRTGQPGRRASDIPWNDINGPIED
jgi:hypothetical protein